MLRVDSRLLHDTTMQTQNYLTKVWDKGFRLYDVETIEINGMEAATGAGRISGKNGQRDVRVIAIRFAPDQVYRLLFLTPPDQPARFEEEFRRTTYSFRRLSVSEAAALKPLRVRVITVRKGDTQESLARRMLLEDYPLERFRVLNGLRASDALAPGRRVKIVSE